MTEEEKIIQRQLEAEKKIRKMQTTIEAINVNRVCSTELDEVQSLDSSKVDYAEIFEEKFKDVEMTLDQIHHKFRDITDKIEDTRTELKRDNLVSSNKHEKYINILHQEFDSLVESKSRAQIFKLSRKFKFRFIFLKF